MPTPHGAAEWPMSSLLCAEPLFRAAGAALTTLPRVPGVWKKALEEEVGVSLEVFGVEGSGVLMPLFCLGPEGERGVPAGETGFLPCSGTTGDERCRMLISDASITL